MKKSKILKVLEKVPSGTKLYSTAFGNLELESIVEAWGNKRIKLMEDNKDRRVYLPDGRYRKGGEVTLYPSREMRDWDKFAWKKGDVLTNNKGAFCIFKEFSGYPYTNFVAIFVHIAGVSTSDSAVEITQEWHEVEKPKFRDGDILTCLDAAFHASSTFIFKHEHEYGYSCHAGIEISGKLYIISGAIWCGKCGNIRYATSEEKIKLFNALTKEGKRWNAEKKVIEDIKPVPKFEPFEKVLCRDYKDSVWDVDFFGFKVKNETETSFIYRCVGNIYKYCIPYKGNEHLLGTSKDPEEK